MNIEHVSEHSQVNNSLNSTAMVKIKSYRRNNVFKMGAENKIYVLELSRVSFSPWRRQHLTGIEIALVLVVYTRAIRCENHHYLN